LLKIDNGFSGMKTLHANQTQGFMNIGRSKERNLLNSAVNDIPVGLNVTELEQYLKAKKLEGKREKRAIIGHLLNMRRNGNQLTFNWNNYKEVVAKVATQFRRNVQGKIYSFTATATSGILKLTVTYTSDNYAATNVELSDQTMAFLNTPEAGHLTQIKPGPDQKMGFTAFSQEVFNIVDNGQSIGGMEFDFEITAWDIICPPYRDEL